jgi:Cdc6-like AAA superfamily ATPase
LQHEILEHAIQCKTYVEKFHGRTDVLNKVKKIVFEKKSIFFYQLEEYIKNEKENRPCIVYGASGCGKTSVLAKAATEVYATLKTIDNQR